MTHVVWKEGTKATVDKGRKRPSVHFVTVLWVEACREKGARVPEAGFVPDTNVATPQKVVPPP